MSTTSPLDAPQPSASAPALPLREPLLDPFVCGIREIDEPLPALLVHDPLGIRGALEVTTAPEDPAPSASRAG